MATAVAFGLIHRFIGPANEAVDILIGARLTGRDADRKRDARGAIANNAGQRRRHADTERLRPLRRRHVVGATQPKGKFITAQPDRQI